MSKINDLLKRRGFLVKPFDNSIDCDLNYNNNKSIDLSTNSLISNSPLNLLISHKRITSRERQIIKEKNLKVLKGKFT
jgi:hypothetical protein